MQNNLTTKTEEEPSASFEQTCVASGAAMSSLPDYLLEGLMVPVSNDSAQRPERFRKREVTIATLKEAAPRLTEVAEGIKMLSATTVLVMLVKLGEPLHLRCSTALGHVLGKEGLKLPSIRIRGRRRYAMHMLACTDEEKALFQAWLDGLGATARQSLRVA